MISSSPKAVRPHVTKFQISNHRIRASLLGLVTILVLLVVAACGTDEPKNPSPTTAPSIATGTSVSAQTSKSEVNVKIFRFEPTSLKVPIGATVKWTNSDEILHTVTSGAPGQEDAKFNGDMNGQGTSFTFAFTTPGTYSYFCSRHNGMRGEVDVS